MPSICLVISQVYFAPFDLYRPVHKDSDMSGVRFYDTSHCCCYIILMLLFHRNIRKVLQKVDSVIVFSQHSCHLCVSISSLCAAGCSFQQPLSISTCSANHHVTSYHTCSSHMHTCSVHIPPRLASGIHALLLWPPDPLLYCCWQSSNHLNTCTNLYCNFCKSHELPCCPCTFDS